MKTAASPTPTFDEKPTLTAEVLRKTLWYSPDTGRFVWLKSTGAARSGVEAGGVSSTGYVRIALFGRRYQAHQLAWLHYYGEWPGELDHINGDKADNRIANLRKSLRDENLQNQRKAHGNNKAGILGVSLTKRGRFVVMIQSGGKRKYLGSYATAEEAEAAYLKAKRDTHPFGTLEEPSAIPERLERKKGTGEPGVWVRRGRFRAYYTKGGRQVCAGTFDTLDEAVQARKMAMIGM